jgi:SNF family Na+-dependent transporter
VTKKEVNVKMNYKSTLMMIIGISLIAVYTGIQTGSEKLVDTFMPFLQLGTGVWMIFILFTFLALFKRHL